MARIILFRPIEFYSYRLALFRPPLGLLYLAAELKKNNFSVVVIDAFTSPDWETVLRRSLGSDTILAGVGVMTGYQIKGALDFARIVKQSGSAPVVWGGLHASLVPRQTIDHELVDMVVIGEGEHKIVRLATCLLKGGSLREVPGIMFKHNGEIVSTSRAEGFIDMNRLPLPDYGQLNVDHYMQSEESLMGEGIRSLDLNTDRGCPYRCGFCYNLTYNHRKWRCMDAERVLENASELTEKYHLTGINFVGDNFCVNPQRVRSICKGILERGLQLRWHMDIRIDTFLQLDDQLLDLLKRSGCHRLTFGVESGSQRVLDYIKKDIRAEDVLKAHKRARSYGFAVSYHFMVGFPDETRKDILLTLRLIRRLLRNDDVQIFGPSIYVPYPGTPLYLRSIERGFIPPRSLESWIPYDWDTCPRYPWQSSAHRRHIRYAKFLVEQAAAERRQSRMGRIIKSFFRLRLSAYALGLTLTGLDIHLLMLLQTLWKLTLKRPRKWSCTPPGPSASTIGPAKNL